MFRFFRNLRQSLLRENKVTRYFLYAFGEILLVVIGILLALQINTWNEERKQRIEERAILINLLEDLEAAKVQSADHIADERKLINDLVLLLGIHPDGRELSSAELQDDDILSIIWNFQSNVPVINSYAEIKNTGKASVISNQRIRELFTNLELNLTSLSTQVKDRLTVQQLRIDDIPEEELNFVHIFNSSASGLNVDLSKEVKNDYRALFKKPEVRNLMVIKLLLSEDVLKDRQELLNAIDLIINLIQAELKSF